MPELRTFGEEPPEKRSVGLSPKWRAIDTNPDATVRVLHEALTEEEIHAYVADLAARNASNIATITVVPPGERAQRPHTSRSSTGLTWDDLADMFAAVHKRFDETAPNSAPAAFAKSVAAECRQRGDEADRKARRSRPTTAVTHD